VVANAARTPSGYLGGLPQGHSAPPRVVLGPGQSAYALIEALDAATDGSGACAGRAATALLVTAPDQRSSTSLPVAFAICADFAVHPVVASTAQP